MPVITKDPTGKFGSRLLLHVSIGGDSLEEIMHSLAGCRVLPDDAIGYGLPTLEKLRAMKPPKKVDQYKSPPSPKN